MNMIGDMNKFTQYEVAQSIPIAAANEGGGAVGIGAGLGAGMAIGQTMAEAVQELGRRAQAPQRAAAAAALPAAGGAGKRSHKILLGVRQADSSRQQVLPGMRQAPSLISGDL